VTFSRPFGTRTELLGPASCYVRPQGRPLQQHDFSPACEVMPSVQQLAADKMPAGIKRRHFNFDKFG
jgi:hypothetical protein